MVAFLFLYCCFCAAKIWNKSLNKQAYNVDEQRVMCVIKATFADTFTESVWQIRLNLNGKSDVQRMPRKHGILYYPEKS